MAVVCPSVTATDPHEYRRQIEQIATFVHRVHLDFMDGVLAPTKSQAIEQTWWPAGVSADLHLMYKTPAEHLDHIIRLEPNLVIIHAESTGNFIAFAEKLRDADIKLGVALLQDTKTNVITPGLDYIDHVLIFSGHLGRFGGQADLGLLDKVQEIRNLKPSIEIGWDGGINAGNISQLADGGIDVLNVGGFIQKSDDPAKSYDTLKALVEKQR